MRATPMPALPAPTSTMRCCASSLLLLPCTRSAPYTPATAVAAVPCKRDGMLPTSAQHLCFPCPHSKHALQPLSPQIRSKLHSNTHKPTVCLPACNSSNKVRGLLVT